MQVVASNESLHSKRITRLPKRRPRANHAESESRQAAMTASSAEDALTRCVALRVPAVSRSDRGADDDYCGVQAGELTHGKGFRKSPASGANALWHSIPNSRADSARETSLHQRAARRNRGP